MVEHMPPCQNRWLAVNDHEVFDRARNLVVYEGLITYGGMAGRDMEALAIGIKESVSAGRDPDTGNHRYPALELTRLTKPRRVYTQKHMDVVAESVKAVYDVREQAQGLRMDYEPDYLRFFQARFEPLE
jgi:tryptophanase